MIRRNKIKFASQAWSNEKQRLGIITQGFPYSGEQFLETEARALERVFGDRLTWFPRASGDLIPILTTSVVTQYSRGLLWKFAFGVFRFPTRAFLFELQLLLKNRDVKGVTPLLLASLDAGARLSHILRSPRCDVYYSYWSSVDGLVATLAAKRVSAKAIVRSHRSDFYPQRSGRPTPFVHFLHSRRGAPTMQIYLSEKARRYAQKNFGTVPSMVSPLGIDIDPETGQGESKAMEKSETARRTLISASTAAAVKRLGLIAEVFEDLEKTGHTSRWIHFGADCHEFFAAVGEKHRSQQNVECRGLLPNDEFRKELQVLDDGFFVNLSSSEGLPVTLLEAAASGIPIVATDVGNVSDLIHSETGLLVQPDTAATHVSAQVRDWLEKSDLMAQASAAKERVFKDYNSEPANLRILRLIEEIH